MRIGQLKVGDDPRGGRPARQSRASSSQTSTSTQKKKKNRASNWVRKVDPVDGKPYYLNQKTGEVSLEDQPPTSSDEEPAKESKADERRRLAEERILRAEQGSSQGDGASLSPPTSGEEGRRSRLAPLGEEEPAGSRRGSKQKQPLLSDDIPQQKRKGGFKDVVDHGAEEDAGMGSALMAEMFLGDVAEGYESDPEKRKKQMDKLRQDAGKQRRVELDEEQALLDAEEEEERLALARARQNQKSEQQRQWESMAILNTVTESDAKEIIEESVLLKFFHAWVAYSQLQKQILQALEKEDQLDNFDMLRKCFKAWDQVFGITPEGVKQGRMRRYSNAPLDDGRLRPFDRYQAEVLGLSEAIPNIPQVLSHAEYRHVTGVGAHRPGIAIRLLIDVRNTICVRVHITAWRSCTAIYKAYRSGKLQLRKKVRTETTIRGYDARDWNFWVLNTWRKRRICKPIVKYWKAHVSKVYRRYAWETSMKRMYNHMMPQYVGQKRYQLMDKVYQKWSQYVWIVHAGSILDYDRDQMRADASLRGWRQHEDPNIKHYPRFERPKPAVPIKRKRYVRHSARARAYEAHVRAVLGRRDPKLLGFQGWKEAVQTVKQERERAYRRRVARERRIAERGWDVDESEEEDAEETGSEEEEYEEETDDDGPPPPPAPDPAQEAQAEYPFPKEGADWKPTWAEDRPESPESSSADEKQAKPPEEPQGSKFRLPPRSRGSKDSRGSKEEGPRGSKAEGPRGSKAEGPRGSGPRGSGPRGSGPRGSEEEGSPERRESKRKSLRGSLQSFRDSTAAAEQAAADHREARRRSTQQGRIEEEKRKSSLKVAEAQRASIEKAVPQVSPKKKPNKFEEMRKRLDEAAAVDTPGSTPKDTPRMTVPAGRVASRQSSKDVARRASAGDSVRQGSELRKSIRTPGEEAISASRKSLSQRGEEKRKSKESAEPRKSIAERLKEVAQMADEVAGAEPRRSSKERRSTSKERRRSASKERDPSRRASSKSRKSVVLAEPAEEDAASPKERKSREEERRASRASRSESPGRRTSESPARERAKSPAAKSPGRTSKSPAPRESRTSKSPAPRGSQGDAPRPSRPSRGSIPTEDNVAEPAPSSSRRGTGRSARG